MISSPAAQIMTTIAESHTVMYKGKEVPGYAATQGVMMAIIFLSVAFLAAIGPEYKGRMFEKAAALGDDSMDKIETMDELERQETGDIKYGSKATHIEHTVQKS